MSEQLDRDTVFAALAYARHNFGLDDAARRGSDWFHKPFSDEEADDHPDGARIRATAEALVDAVVRFVAASLED